MVAKPKRLIELDALRGFAALGVVLSHFTSRFDVLYGHSQGLWFFLPRGEYGVKLFFILSGFVIFLTLDQTKKPMDFVVSRFSRLYPTYWVSVILTFFTVYLFGLPGLETNWKTMALNLTMLNNYWGLVNVDEVYWTLQLELSFYVAMFLLYVFDQLKNINIFLFAALIVAWANQIFRADLVLQYSFYELFEKWFVLRCIPYFALGISLYQFWKANGLSKSLLGIVGLSLSLIGFSGTFFTLFLFVILTLIVGCAVKGKLNFLSWKPFVFLGGISYPLYLTHQHLGFMIIRWGYHKGLHPNFSVAIAIAFCLLLATAISYFVERPALKWIRSKVSSPSTKLSDLYPKPPSLAGS